MPIFTYTTKKLLKSPMNLIIFILSIIGLGLFYYLISYLSNDIISEKIDEITSQNINIDWYSFYKSYFWTGWQLGILSLLISIFLFIFIALNSTKILRDEIDDGTLLILVSKPLARSRIWLEKVLSLQVVIIGFVFLSLIFSSFLLPIPFFGGFWAFRTFFPFMFIAFGLILIIEIFVSAISFLISIFLRSIVVGSIVIGIGFFFIVSNQIIDRIISTGLPSKYGDIARAAYTFKKIYNNVPEETQKRLIDQNPAMIENTKNMFNKMYQTYIFKDDNQKTFPEWYSSQDEQTIVKTIATATNDDWKDVYPELEGYEELIHDIYYVSAIMRSNVNLSYYQMLISNNPQTQPFNSEIHQHNTTGQVIFNNNYSLSTVFYVLNTVTLSQTEYNHLQDNLSRLIILRRINPFYQLSYVWDGFFNDESQHNLTSISPLGTQVIQPWAKDPYRVNLVKNNNYEYGIDIKNCEFQNSQSKILSWTLISVIYSILGIALFGLSLYLFLRKDFT